jgi:hypothetical protein
VPDQPTVEILTSAYARPTRYTVNLVPEEADPVGIYAITVDYCGDQRWAVLRHSLCLSADGRWDRERVTSERKAILRSTECAVTEADEPAIREWLTRKARYVAAIWEPLLDRPAPAA